MQTLVEATKSYDATADLSAVQVERPAELSFGKNFTGTLETISYWISGNGNKLFTLTFVMENGDYQAIIVRPSILKGILTDNNKGFVINAGLVFSTGTNPNKIAVN